MRRQCADAIEGNRPYVWDEADQWQPLWDDVRRLAELNLASPQTLPTHFLGAVVIQAQGAATGTLPARNVIDGQQRLTTLQLLMDAAGAVLEDAGHDALALQLEGLTRRTSSRGMAPASSCGTPTATGTHSTR